MSLISFEQVHNRWKEGGKMAYWLFKKSSLASHSKFENMNIYHKKIELRKGGNRNNFSILL